METWFERRWSTLSKMVIELMKRGVNVSDLIDMLGVARGYINLYNSHKKTTLYKNCYPKLETYITQELRDIEDLLIMKAANEVGESFAINMTAKLLEERKEFQKKDVRLALGIPSEKKSE
mgnify:CR=1 FL=1